MPIVYSSCEIIFQVLLCDIHHTLVLQRMKLILNFLCLLVFWDILTCLISPCSLCMSCICITMPIWTMLVHYGYLDLHFLLNLSNCVLVISVIFFVIITDSYVLCCVGAEKKGRYRCTRWFRCFCGIYLSYHYSIMQKLIVYSSYFSAGIVTEDINWPPIFPVIHHDIRNEIPVHLQKLQYVAFTTFLGMTKFSFLKDLLSVAQ